LVDGLKTVARAELGDVLKGKVLIGTASSGTQVTFTLPPLGSLTAEDIAEVCSRLLDQCDTLIEETPTLESDSEALKVALLGIFKPGIRSFQSDFRRLQV
jgi:predicted MarR family transcription regulator